jgi:hypothetical protein
MPDKRPHIKPEELASLIRQYLAGELDDKAMHALERQALDDPFLADALDGYAMHSPDQQAHQEDLTGRLAARVAPARGRVRALYYRWAAVAAILLLMVTAGWYLWREQQVAPPIASVKSPAAPAADSGVPAAADTAAMLAKVEKSAKEDAVSEPPMLAKAKEMKPRAKDVPSAAPVVSPPAAAAAGAEVSAYTKNDDSSGKLIAQGTPGVSALTPSARDNNRAFMAQHNVDSKILAPKPGIPGDSASSALSEVVVVGMAVKKKQNMTGSVVIRGLNANTDSGQLERSLSGRVAGVQIESDAENPGYQAPEPVIGWTAFENYLHTKTVNPDDKYKGIVRVAFTVMPDGTLQNFKILRSLNEICDAEAIRVIKEGPKWSVASDRKPARVKVKVLFRGRQAE